MIDVSGTPDALAVKYAYVRNICELKKSYTVEEYIEWRKEDKDKLKEAVEYINEVAVYKFQKAGIRSKSYEEIKKKLEQLESD